MSRDLIKINVLNIKNNHNKNEFIRRANIIHNSKYDYSKVVYKNNDTKITITCPIHGDFLQSPQHHLNGSGCNLCYLSKRKLTKNEFIRRANIIHNSKYDYSKVVYKNTCTKVEIVCPKHGSFWQEPYSHYSKKNKCPKCSKDINRITLDDFIKRAKTKHNNKYDYTCVNIDSYSSNVDIKCPKHGMFTQRVGNHLNGSGCPKCYLENSRKNVVDFIKDAKLIHGNKYDYSKVEYLHNKHPVEIVCPKHGSFWVNPNRHISSKSGCPKCNESKGEVLIGNLLDKYKIPYIKEYKLKPYLYRYDFYLPEHNIFIEFNGIQHYKPVSIFGGVEEFKKTLKRDIEKRELVKSFNGTLITLTHIHLSNNRLELELLRGLKRSYWYWLLINNKLVVFKNISSLCQHFNLSNKLNTKEILEVLNNKLGKVTSLF